MHCPQRHQDKQAAGPYTIGGPLMRLCCCKAQRRFRRGWEPLVAALLFFLFVSSFSWFAVDRGELVQNYPEESGVGSGSNVIHPRHLNCFRQWLHTCTPVASCRDGRIMAVNTKQLVRNKVFRRLTRPKFTASQHHTHTHTHSLPPFSLHITYLLLSPPLSKAGERTS